MGNIGNPSVIWLEVQKLLKIGVVKEVLPVAEQIVSTVFLVPKKNGSQRMISNLRRLNQYIDYEHFKISSVSEARMLVQHGSFMASVDLEKVYYKKYLCFSVGERLLEFQVLPNGLSSCLSLRLGICLRKRSIWRTMVFTRKRAFRLKYQCLRVDGYS